VEGVVWVGRFALVSASVLQVALCQVASSSLPGNAGGEDAQAWSLDSLSRPLMRKQQLDLDDDELDEGFVVSESGRPHDVRAHDFLLSERGREEEDAEEESGLDDFVDPVGRLGQSNLHGPSFVELASPGVGSHWCGKYGDRCHCDGVIAFGHGTSWTSLRTEGTVACTRETFAVDGPGDQRDSVCYCYSLAWCAENKPRGNWMPDSWHRRRDNTGRPGRDSHQRRRWCGWGPRDCLWTPWGDWGACSVPAGERIGEQVRTRAQQTTEANGGLCEGSPSMTQKCQ